MPVEIPAHASCDIHLDVTFTGKDDEFVRLIHVYGEAAREPVASAILRGTIRDATD
jgi:hypothetical protein